MKRCRRFIAMATLATVLLALLGTQGARGGGAMTIIATGTLRYGDMNDECDVDAYLEFRPGDPFAVSLQWTPPMADPAGFHCRVLGPTYESNLLPSTPVTCRGSIGNEGDTYWINGCGEWRITVSDADVSVYYLLWSGCLGCIYGLDGTLSRLY